MTKPKRRPPSKKKGQLAAQKKLEAWVEVYLQTWNATEASRQTGCKTDVAAWQQGYRMSRNVEVQRLIAERLKEKAMSADEVLARLSDHARGDLSSFMKVDKDGRIWWNFASPQARQYGYLLKKVRTKTETEMHGRGKAAKPVTIEWTEVELHDAQHALELLAKHHKLLSDEVNLHAKLTIENFQEALKKAHAAAGK